MRNLIWKQWHESKTLFYIFTAWMLISVFIVLSDRSSLSYADALLDYNVFLYLYLAFAAIILACQASQGERAAGTLAFTKSLPIPLKHIAATKIIGSILTLSVPIVIASLVLMTAVNSGLFDRITGRSSYHETIGNAIKSTGNVSSVAPTFSSLLTNVTAIAIVCGVQLLLLLSLFGCYMRNHVQVGFLSPIVILAGTIFSSLTWNEFSKRPDVLVLYGAISPFSLLMHGGPTGQVNYYDQAQLIQYRWMAIGLSLPLLAVMAYGYVSQFGKDHSPRGSLQWLRYPSLPSTFSLASRPISKQWVALVWLELRQAIPLAIYGLILAILLTFILHFVEEDNQNTLDSLARLSPGVVAVTGMFWSIVVGSGVFSTDNISSLGRFRRTRPIPHGKWFWTKFSMGLAAVLIILDGVIVLFSWIVLENSNRLGFAYIACFPMIHAFLFSISVLGTCLFRKPLIGSFVAVLTIIATFLLFNFLDSKHRLGLLTVANNLMASEDRGEFSLLEHGYPITYGALALTTIACAFLSFYFSKKEDPPLKLFEKVPG